MSLVIKHSLPSRHDITRFSLISKIIMGLALFIFSGICLFFTFIYYTSLQYHCTWVYNYILSTTANNYILSGIKKLFGQDKSSLSSCGRILYIVLPLNNSLSVLLQINDRRAGRRCGGR